MAAVAAARAGRSAAHHSDRERGLCGVLLDDSGQLVSAGASRLAGIRGCSRLRGGGGGGTAPPPAAVERSGADPRAVLVAATVVTAVLLLTPHSWVVLAAVTVWLGGAAFLARHGEREVVRIGLLLAAMLAAGTLVVFGGGTWRRRGSQPCRARRAPCSGRDVDAGGRRERWPARGVSPHSLSAASPARSRRCCTSAG